MRIEQDVLKSFICQTKVTSLSSILRATPNCCRNHIPNIYHEWKVHVMLENLQQGLAPTHCCIHKLSGKADTAIQIFQQNDESVCCHRKLSAIIIRFLNDPCPYFPSDCDLKAIYLPSIVQGTLPCLLQDNVKSIKSKSCMRIQIAGGRMHHIHIHKTKSGWTWEDLWISIHQRLGLP